MNNYKFNKFSWCYDTVIKVTYKDTDNLVVIHDHVKILDKIDKHLENDVELKDAKLLIEKIKNKN